MNARTLAILAPILLASCATVPPPHANFDERGPDGTRAFYVQVEANEPNLKVEVNGDLVGVTPLRLRIWGDKDGTFHNFGRGQYTIKVLPSRPGQWVQTKTFLTGGWFEAEDMIPQKLYFDVNLQSAEPVRTINLNVQDK